jgi:hypothetical protein
MCTGGHDTDVYRETVYDVQGEVVTLACVYVYGSICICVHHSLVINEESSTSTRGHISSGGLIYPPPPESRSL